MKTKNHRKMNIVKIKGFTLVELIVVITILVILGTIAFINLGGFAGSARDSARISNLNSLKTGLDLVQIKSGSYPLPEGYVTLTASGTPIGYQGYAGEQVASLAKLSPGATVDPLDPTMYITYSVNLAQSKMQAMVFLEDSSTATAFVSSLTPTANASSTSDYNSRYPTTLGASLGILLNNGTGSTKNQPVQELLSASFTGVDVVNTNSGYLAVFSNTDKISGTGNILSLVSNMGAKSCNDLLVKDSSKKNKDGTYFINPTMSSSSSGTFQVYCDMTTDGGGWTLVMQAGSYWSFDFTTWHTTDFLNLTSASSLTSTFKLSDDYINLLKGVGYRVNNSFGTIRYFKPNCLYKHTTTASEDCLKSYSSLSWGDMITGTSGITAEGMSDMVVGGSCIFTRGSITTSYNYTSGKMLIMNDSTRDFNMTANLECGKTNPVSPGIWGRVWVK